MIDRRVTRLGFLGVVISLSLIPLCLVASLAPLIAAEGKCSDDPAAEVERLAEQLHSSAPAGQIEAVRALGRLKDARAEKVLANAVVFLTGPVKIAAKDALRQREGSKTATSEQAGKLVMPQDVRRLVVDLGSSYPAVRVWAAREFMKLGPQAADAVPDSTVPRDVQVA